MSKSRVFLHPLISNPRSRSVLISFTITIVGATVVLWLKIMSVLGQAGLGFDYFRTINTVPLLRLILSSYAQIAIVFLSVLIAAATTAISIVGPVKRLEQWLLDWDMGHPLSPLKSRSGDSYDNLIRLINDLYSVKKSVRKK
jgi:hypothetical protein